MYLTYGEGLKFTLTEFESLSLRRIIKYINMMDKQKAREKAELDAIKAKNNS